MLVKYDDKTQLHTIKIDKSNDSALPPEVTFSFDGDGRVIDNTQYREIDVLQTLHYVFRDGQSRDWRQLRKDFVAKSGVKENEAFSYIQAAQKNNWILTELDGNLNLNKDYF